MSTFPGPTPAYTNPPIEPEFYFPSRFTISNITLGRSTTITTSTDHNYVVGQLIRTLVPSPYQTIQINERTGYVTSIPSSTQIVVDIDSSFFNSFNASPTYAPTPPQVVAVGDINTPAANSTGSTNLQTTIPGSFQNIS